MRNVVVTTGSSGGFLLAFLAAFDAGDVVAMARPGYPAYRNILASLGCVVAEFDCGPEEHFIPSVAALERLDRPPAGLIIASPANPTGAMVPDARLAELAAWCRAHGVRLISDEIYHGIGYTGPAASAWQYRPRRDRGELVLQVLLDDRLAAGLAAGARRAARRRRPAGRQLRDLPAGACRSWPRCRPSTAYDELDDERRPLPPTTGNCC